MWIFQCVLVIFVCRLSVLESTATDLCDNQFCVCKKDTSGFRTLECAFEQQQDLILAEHSPTFDQFSSIRLSNLAELKISFSRHVWKNLQQIKVEHTQTLDLQPVIADNNKNNNNNCNNCSVHLHNVSILAIPSNAFSVFSNVRISSSRIGDICSDAFKAYHISSILIEHSSIHHIQMGAFSNRTFLENLALHHVQVNSLKSNAITSAFHQLSIQHSNISDIYSGGIDTVVVSVKMSSNIISSIQESGIILNDTNNITMENNTFRKLHSKALSIYNTNMSNVKFKFVGNAIGETNTESLNFRFGDLETEVNKSNIKLSVNENYFVKLCDCYFYNFVKGVVYADFVQMFYETSFCNVNLLLSQCLKKPEGLLNVKNFTDSICVQNFVCDTEINIETTKTRRFPGLTDTFNLVFDGNNDEYNLVRYACIALVILMLVILLFISCLFMKQKRVFSKVKSNVFMTLYSKLCLRNTSSKCPTKTKIFSNDYSELNKHVSETKIDMNDIVLDNQVNYDHMYIHKATQTLPEELTQELLQNLRVKLEDPNEYSLARDMIEHLYDLIKIEESCNRNVYSTGGENHYMSTALGGKEDNIYDEIEIRPSKIDTSFKHPSPNVLSTFQNFSDRTLSPPIIKNNKKFVNVGTRAPSPDKLLPYDFPNKRVTLLEEYQMPSDNNSSFIYSEIPPDPNSTQLPRDQLKLLDEMNDAINIYIDTSLRGSTNDIYFNRPLPRKPEL